MPETGPFSFKYSEMSTQSALIGNDRSDAGSSGRLRACSSSCGRFGSRGLFAIYARTYAAADS